MRTRCPRCRTVFRITPEQLRARAGTVRCGHCQAIFNALESLLEEPATSPTALPSTPETPLPHEAAKQDWGGEKKTAAPEEAQPTTLFSPTADEAMPATNPVFLEETPEESTQAAREAGLAAVREFTGTPGYNRWAAGTLAGLEPESRQRPNWPFLVAALFLFVTLALQVGLHFRTGLVRHLPSLGTLFTALDIAVPLPRQAELVSIEASDLQADQSRGLLVLQATLKNSAPYAQAWPALELTLTDTHDTVVARRLLTAADYLPPRIDPSAFPAHGETAIRLWIEVREVAASGYRLYLFYP